MNSTHKHRPRLTQLLVLALSCALSFSTFQVASEDIDIFSVDVNQTVNKPNVLIVLDNSANWSRASQQWPSRDTQGESEVVAIRDVIIGSPDDPSTPDINEFSPGLPDNSVNVGILEFITGGNAGENDSGFVRMDIQPINASTKPVLAGHMNTIANNINSPDEKRSQSNPFGNLFWDVYNYLAGTTASQNGAGTLDALSDDNAYTTKHSLFESPLTSADTCTRTVVIFIGNNVSTGPTADSAANVTALSNLGGNTSQIQFANYDIKTVQDTAPAGYMSSACYSGDATGLSQCTTAEANTTACTDAGFTSCFCSATSTVACDTLRKYEIHGQQVSRVVSPSVSPNPATTVTNNATIQNIAQQCPNNQATPSPQPSCPATTTVTTAGPGANQSTETTTSWSSCFWSGQANACGNPNNPNKTLFTAKGTKTVTKTVYDVTLGALGPVSPAANSTCRTGTGSCTALDFPASCSNGTYQNCACTGAGDPTGCGGAAGTVQYSVFGNLTATVEAIANGTFRAPPTQGGKNFMSDEWARFLFQQGVPLPGGAGRSPVSTYTIDVFNAQQNVDFSALLFNIAREGQGKYFQARNENQLRDALGQIFSEVQAVNSAFASASLPVNATNRAQNENQIFIGLFRPDRIKRPRWFGNLKRYQAVSQGATVVLGDVNGNLAVNPLTGFLAECAVSFWTTASGNYWLNVTTDDPPAVGQCGTVANSAHSDLPDGPFVEKGAVAEVLRKGNGNSTTVEGNFSVNRTIKTVSGGALVDFTSANLPDAIDWDGDGDVGDTADVNRKPLVANVIRGEDRLDEDGDSSAAPTTGLTEPRSTIHGDVIHSRPQPVNYGDFDGNPANGIEPGVVIFYGANDGTFRAVKASTGQELWAFVAPEHYSKLPRLVDNTPNIRYYPDTTGRKKDYFFDGSTGLFQNADNSKVYIFPTMRRGGRKVYAFNITDDPNVSTDGASNPAYLWSRGCTDTGVCDNNVTVGDFSAMGQTWSLPAPGTIAGVSSGNQPIVVWGGGYDPCEDADHASPPACSTALGRGVYVVNADNGNLIRYFDFSSFPGARSVAADVALVDTNNDGKADHAYAVDTGGSVYRVSFVDTAGAAITNPANWTARRIARTNQAIGAGDADVVTDADPRKFLFRPALFQANDKVMYVAVGTGDREAPLLDQYPYDDRTGNGTSDGGVTNRFYVFKDDLTNGTSEIDLDLVSSSNMLDYTNETNPCCNEPVLPGDPSTNDGDPNTPGWDTQPKGYFITLNENGQGEQVVTSAVIVAGFLIFSTNRPTAPSVTACSNSLGEARGYFLNLFNGSGAIGVEGSQGGDRSSVFVGGGLPPSPVVAVIPIDGRLTTVVIGAAQKDGTASSSIELQPPPIPIRTRRTPVYWFKSLDTDT